MTEMEKNDEKDEIKNVKDTVQIDQKPPKPLTALDLFSGTGSVGRALKELGYEVTSLDIAKGKNPDIVCDIMKWNFKNFEPESFDVIVAGVPCNEYSAAKTVGERKIEQADQITQKNTGNNRIFEPPHMVDREPPHRITQNPTLYGKHTLC